MPATAPPRRISPMGFSNPGVFVRRAYREGKPFQWVRESYVNGDEAAATEVRFDVDLISYRDLGVLRMQVEDNGTGIAADDIDSFLNTFGGGGKPIGDEHDNFGVGFKSAVTPWNEDGVVVRSLNNGEISISVLVFDQTTGEIGLLHLPLADEDDVDASTEYATTLVFDKVADYDAGETWIWGGIDWLQSFPEWIANAGHGSSFTFLGSAAYPDSYFGDPTVDEERSGRWAYVWYADRRFWEIPTGKLRFYGTDSLDRKRIMAALDQKLKRPAKTKVKHWQARNARGLRDSIFMLPVKKLKALGLWTDPVDDDTDDEDIDVAAEAVVKGLVKTVTFDIGADNLPAKCHVFYKDLPASIDPAKDFGWDPARTGVITALYKNECYDTDRGHRHRQFGIPYSPIYNMVWIVVEPVLAGAGEDGEEAEGGVYPGTSRSFLHWKGAGTRAADLPWQEWADEFIGRMEDEVPFLYDAIKNFVPATKTGDDLSKSLLKRTADKFKGRFKPLPKPPTYSVTKRPAKRLGALKPAGEGDKIADAGENPGSSGGVRGKGKRRRTPSTGPNPGTKPGTNAGDKSGTQTIQPRAKGALRIVKQANDDDTLPPFVWVDFNVTIPEELKEPGMADLGILYIPLTDEVHCHSKHDVITEVVEYWVGEYGEVHRATVVEAVQDVYGTAASTAVGHIMRQKLDPDTLKHRLDELTSKFYGLYEAHELIGQRIRGTLGHKAKKAVGGTP